MRSRFVRLTIGTIALLAFAGSAFLIVNSEKHIAQSRAGVHTFDQHSRETRDLIGDLRFAQQSYVAAGQNRDFWLAKTETARDEVIARATALRTEAASGTAKVSIDKAVEALNEFKSVDTRVRDYLAAGQELMASDVVFTEGGASIATASQEVDAAHAAEEAALDASEADTRKQQELALAGAGVLGLLIVALLALTGASTESAESLMLSDTAAGSGSDLPLNYDASSASKPVARAESPLLKAAAELCTDFGRVRDTQELNALLARAAVVMEATGLVVWLGTTDGADLRPVLAHGYSAAAIARMPAVPRTGNNAAAAAYRTSNLQIVLSQPGGAAGAIVAPLMSSEGCIGALSIEIKGGGETSDAIQAIAGILAAQLSGVLAVSAAQTANADGRAAAAQG